MSETRFLEILEVIKNTTGEFVIHPYLVQSFIIITNVLVLASNNKSSKLQEHMTHRQFPN